LLIGPLWIVKRMAGAIGLKRSEIRH
jgi:hypothetical protein